MIATGSIVFFRFCYKSRRPPKVPRLLIVIEDHTFPGRVGSLVHNGRRLL
jgi:hypothetical protein